MRTAFIICSFFSFSGKSVSIVLIKLPRAAPLGVDEEDEDLDPNGDLKKSDMFFQLFRCRTVVVVVESRGTKIFDRV